VTGADPLFPDPEFLRTLSYLDLAARQLFAGTRRGERRSSRRGAGTIFSDHRPYSRGDDLRYVDWNVYGRLGALFVKEFEVEESADVRLLLDRSRSMEFGSPAKLDFARRVAAALGYVGLAHLDRVELIPIGEGEVRSFSGKTQAPLLFTALARVEAGGETDLLAGVRRALAAARGRGIAIVLSDFLDPAGWRSAVDFLLHRRQQVFLVHVVAATEEAPPRAGAVRLVDSETGRTRRVRVTEEHIRLYAERFARFCTRLEIYARDRGIGYARVRSDLPFGPAVLGILRRGGVVR
jgi:uncharacterized protein (DUF58 family)